MIGLGFTRMSLLKTGLERWLREISSKSSLRKEAMERIASKRSAPKQNSEQVEIPGRIDACRDDLLDLSRFMMDCRRPGIILLNSLQPSAFKPSSIGSQALHSTARFEPYIVIKTSKNRIPARINQTYAPTSSSSS